MRFLLALSAAVAVAAPDAAAQPTPLATLEDSAGVLSELQNIQGRGIPAGLIAEAQAVAIIPRVIKAGFVFGGRGGHGVVLTRTENGGWGDPTFVNIGGASVGLQVGVQATDLVLVFRNRKALDRILDGKGKLTLGADIAVAAGPVGRQAQAGTDARLRSEILSYSRSRGLFAGVALDGAVLTAADSSNRRFQQDTRPETAKALDELRTKLTEMGVEKAAESGDRPPPPLPATPAAPPPTVPDRP